MFFSRKVEVTFVDGATGQAFATTKMPPDQLPETFLVDTTLHLGSDDWTVLKAEPPTRAEFARTRRLVLTLARVRVETVDPGSILFSLPTLNDRLPDEAGPADGTEAVLREDDWRQVEFVPARLRHVVDDEIGAIRRIHHEHRRGVGFTELHVRRWANEPEEVCALGDVRALAPGAARPLRLDGHGQRVRGGFAHTLAGGWMLYGAGDAELVTMLALHPSDGAPPADVIHALEAFAREHELLLVDWCRCARADPATAAFAEIFA